MMLCHTALNCLPACLPFSLPTPVFPPHDAGAASPCELLLELDLGTAAEGAVTVLLLAARSLLTSARSTGAV